MLFMIDNIHNERGTYYTDSALPGYYIMSVVCILYRYQDSALNHMNIALVVGCRWHSYKLESSALNINTHFNTHSYSSTNISEEFTSNN